MGGHLRADKNAAERLQGLAQIRSGAEEAPPGSACNLPRFRCSLWLHFLLEDFQQQRPSTGLFVRHFLEIDHEAAVLVRRAVVDFLPSACISESGVALESSSSNKNPCP